MKYKYFLFGYDTCYPCGGMEDCILKTNDYQEIKDRINLYFNGRDADYDDDDNYYRENYSYYQIYNVKTDKTKTIDMYRYRKGKNE